MPTETAFIPFILPLSAVVGFVTCVLLLPSYIKWLKAKQIGQFIRQEGPSSHIGKAKTPTMGGVCFIASSIVSGIAILVALKYMGWRMIFVLLIGVACGLIGLWDDSAKFRRKANAGISAKLRLLLELALGVILVALLLYHGDGAQIFWPKAVIGFGSQIVGPVLVLPIPIFLVLSAFLMAATTNAVNLHDGMDGLAAGTAMQVLVTMALILAGTGQWLMAALAVATAGGVAGFLIFNRYPAQIFMGDTGSLFLGGIMASLAIAGRIEVWFVPLTLIYIVETLSVMAQVIYFKLTKKYIPEKPISVMALCWLKLTRRLPGEGKRLFRMAPLHHHFEQLAADYGLSEWQVVTGFWFAQFLICTTVLITFELTS